MLRLRHDFMMKVRSILFSVAVALSLVVPASVVVPAHADMDLLKPDEVPWFDKDAFDELSEVEELLEMEAASCAIFIGYFEAQLRCRETFRNSLRRLTDQDPEKCYMEVPANLVNCIAYANRWWLPSQANTFHAFNSNRWDSQFVSSNQAAFRATLAGRTLFHLSIFTDGSQDIQSLCRKNKDVGISFGSDDQRHTVELKRWIRPSNKPAEELSCLFYGFATLDEGTYDIEVSNLNTTKGSIALIKLD